jgi:hypothetical protein
MKKLPQEIRDVLNMLADRTGVDRSKKIKILNTDTVIWNYSKERLCYLLLNGYEVKVKK